MNLPKEVLSLFPTWEYQCPNCQTYVEPTMLFCPKCKTLFDADKWRIPPRFLKNKKAMSDYAHKVLAPKLNSEQRKLLFKYFTVIFNDGFESGDFTAWTLTIGTPTIVTSPVHHGLKSASFDATNEWVYKEFTSTSGELHIRAYIRFSTIPPNTGRLCLLGFDDSVTSNRIPYVELLNDGGTPTWRLVYKNTLDNEVYLTSTTPTPTIDTWYCIEIKEYASINAVEFWIDNVSKGSAVNMNNVAKNRGYVGSRHITLGTNTLTVDCVVVADTYIGPEAGVIRSRRLDIRPRSKIKFYREGMRF